MDEIKVVIENRTPGNNDQIIAANLAALGNMQLYIGIPESAGGDGGMTNAALAFLHSHGSPVNKIPPRPFIEPAIEREDTMSKLTEEFGMAFEAAIIGDIGLARTHLEKAGMIGANAVKSYMGSGALAANAPITINGGWMRNKVSGKPVFIKGKGSSAPLIDTGSLRSSVTYVIEEGGG